MHFSNILPGICQQLIDTHGSSLQVNNNSLCDPFIQNKIHHNTILRNHLKTPQQQHLYHDIIKPSAHHFTVPYYLTARKPPNNKTLKPSVSVPTSRYLPIKVPKQTQPRWLGTCGLLVHRSADGTARLHGTLPSKASGMHARRVDQREWLSF